MPKHRHVGAGEPVDRLTHVAYAHQHYVVPLISQRLHEPCPCLRDVLELIDEHHLERTAVSAISHCIACQQHHVVEVDQVARTQPTVVRPHETSHQAAEELFAERPVACHCSVFKRL